MPPNLWKKRSPLLSAALVGYVADGDTVALAPGYICISENTRERQPMYRRPVETDRLFA